jgi:alpha-D-ribose 1-methylphosphonate 5-triphosphate synthase subunit PhnL
VSLLDKDIEPGADSCAAWYEDALGVVDGGATERVVRRLEQVAAEWPSDAGRRLESDRRRFAAGLLIRSVVAETVWTLAGPAARVAGEQGRVAARRRRAREGRTLAMATLRGVSRGGG